MVPGDPPLSSHCPPHFSTTVPLHLLCPWLGAPSPDCQHGSSSAFCFRSSFKNHLLYNYGEVQTSLPSTLPSSQLYIFLSIYHLTNHLLLILLFIICLPHWNVSSIRAGITTILCPVPAHSRRSTNTCSVKDGSHTQS